MSKYLLFFAFMFITGIIVGQAPVNNTCVFATSVLLDECSQPGEFTTLNSTVSVITANGQPSIPSCWQQSAGDVWFVVNIPIEFADSVVAIDFSINADMSDPDHILYPQVGVYAFPDPTVECTSNNALQLIYCESAEPGQNSLNFFIDIAEFGGASLFYIRVSSIFTTASDFPTPGMCSGVPCGDFQICINSVIVPENEDCHNAAEIAIGDCTPAGAYSTAGSSPSSVVIDNVVTDPGCWDDTSGDVWFTFETPEFWSDSVLLYEFVIQGDMMSIPTNAIQPQFALYRMADTLGTCDDNGLELVLCGQAGAGETSLITSIFGTELELSSTYYIRVGSVQAAGDTLGYCQGGNCGDFTLCINSYPYVDGPANDECSSAIVLIPDNCPQNVYSMFGSTNDLFGSENCGVESGGDVWFSFSTPPTWGDSILAYELLITPVGQMIPTISLFEFDGTGSSCTETGFELISCASMETAEPFLLVYNVNDLQNSTTYFIRLSTEASAIDSLGLCLGANCGTYQICLTIVPDYPEPANNDCAGAFELEWEECGPNNIFTSLGSSPSSISAPACWDDSAGDVWFTFETPLEWDGEQDVIGYKFNLAAIDPNISHAMFAQFALYKYTGPGDCSDSTLELIHCDQANGAGSTLQVELDLEDLDMSSMYYLRIGSVLPEPIGLDSVGHCVGAHCGDFLLCIETILDCIPVENNNCPQSITVPFDFCSDLNEYTTYCSTPSTIWNIPEFNNPDCWDDFSGDVWFLFFAPSQWPEGMDALEIKVSGNDSLGNAILNPQVALYRVLGFPCGMNNLLELDCGQAQLGSNEVSLIIDPNSLDISTPYYIRVASTEINFESFDGDFQLCVRPYFEPPGTDCDNPYTIPGIPFSHIASTEDTENATTVSPCPNDTYLQSNDFFYELVVQDSLCLEIRVVGDPFTGVYVFNGCPYEPGSTCVQNFGVPAGNPTLHFVQLFNPGTYYIVVSSTNATPFTEFTIDITEADCSLEPGPIDVTCVQDGTELAYYIAKDSNIISDIYFHCPPCAAGIFTSPNITNFDIKEGIVMTSGLAESAEGPNNTTAVVSTSHSPWGGDDDLSAYSNRPTRDACILEFDVYAHTNLLSFNYIFGSEEYPNWSSPTSAYNDAFAFFISGPGIDGLKNMALIKNIDHPSFAVDSMIGVAISHTSQYVNTLYWINNMPNPPFTNVNGVPPGPGPGPLAGTAVEYNGYTVTLVAESTVIPCQTYRLKLVIADGSDHILDSGVFIEANSVTTGLGDFDIVLDEPDLGGVLAGCANAMLNIALPQPAEDTIYYRLDFSCGEAINGVHFEYINDTIIFYPGEMLIEIPIITIPVTDPTDCWLDPLDFCIEILQDSALANNSNCFGSIGIINFDLFCDFELEVGPLSSITCDGSPIQLVATGALEYEWAPQVGLSNAYIANPIASPGESTTYIVGGTIGQCTKYDSVYIEVVNTGFMIDNPIPQWICRYDSVQLNASTLLPDAVITWSPNTNISDVNVPNPTVWPLTNTVYTATLTYESCTEVLSIPVNVDPFEIPTVIPDDTICQGTSIQLATMNVPAISIYQWTPTTGLNNPNSPTPIATPTETTTYMLVTTSPITQACKDTQYVTITVVEIFLDLDNELKYICKGDQIQLNALTNTGGFGLTWTPANTLSCSSGCENPIASPTVTTTYTATLQVGTCITSDQVTVRVDSLPNSNVILDSIICENNTPAFLIMSYTIYTPISLYPDIEFEWTPPPNPPGLLYIGNSTPESGNIIVLISETTQFIRCMTNNACFKCDTINVEIKPQAFVDIVQSDTSICVGGEVQLNAIVQPEGEYGFSWSPPDGLSCVDCPDPVASPLVTTTYTVTSGYTDCFDQASITITVGSPDVDLISDTLICAGQSVQIGLAHSEATTYSWTTSTGEVVPPIGDPEVTPPVTTTYILTAYVGDCEVVDSVTVFVAAAPVIELSANASEFCSGETIELSVQSSESTSITWSGPNLNQTSGPNVTANALQQGTYTYSVLVSNQGCNTSAEITVEVFEEPGLDINDDTAICPGQTVVLGNVHDPNATYTWTTNTGETVPAVGNPEVSPAVTTTYTVVAVNGACELTDEITVTVNPLTLDLDESTFICAGESVNLNATGVNGNTWQWEPADGLSCTDCPNPVATPTQTTIYTVTYSLDGECVITDEITVVVGSNFLVEILPDTIVNQGSQVQLSSVVTPLDGSVLGNLTYNWDPVDGLSCFDCPNPLATPNETTSYILTVSSDFGCHGTSNTITIVVDMPLYSIPNAFTPDGDDINDRFTIYFSEGSNVLIRNFRVFNRWGKLIFDNPSLQGWDGRYNGELVPQDVYIYIIELQRADGTIEILKGDVTLLR